MTEIQASHLQMANLGKGPFNVKQGPVAVEGRSSNAVVFSLQQDPVPLDPGEQLPQERASLRLGRRLHLGALPQLLQRPRGLRLGGLLL